MKSAAGGRASERWRGEGRATIARSIARSIARVAGRDKQTCASIHSIAARAIDDESNRGVGVATHCTLERVRDGV
jgi:hypothetical protein